MRAVTSLRISGVSERLVVSPRWNDDDDDDDDGKDPLCRWVRELGLRVRTKICRRRADGRIHDRTLYMYIEHGIYVYSQSICDLSSDRDSEKETEDGFLMFDVYIRYYIIP